MKLPIWSAYILAPVLVVAFAGDVIWQSESPWPLVGYAVGAGLVCASVMHGWSALTTKK